MKHAIAIAVLLLFVAGCTQQYVVVDDEKGRVMYGPTTSKASADHYIKCWKAERRAFNEYHSERLMSENGVSAVPYQFDRRLRVVELY